MTTLRKSTTISGRDIKQQREQYARLSSLVALHNLGDDDPYALDTISAIAPGLSVLDDEKLLGTAPEEVQLDAMADVKLGIVGRDRPWWMLDPEGVTREVWDTCAGILMLEVVISYPVWAGFFDASRTCTYFDAHPKAFSADARLVPTVWLAVQIFANCFFLLDIVVTFFTGLLVRDAVGDMVAVYNLKAVAVAYLTKWFVFEAVACIPMECILSGIDSVPEVWINWGYTVRFLRLLGFQRRNPLDIVGWAYQLLARRVTYFGYNISVSFAFARAILTIFYVCIMMHIWACIVWFTVRAQDFPPNTWPQILGVDGVDYPISRQYVWSLFCAVSGTVGVSYGSYPPFTWQESAVWICLMLTMAGTWFLTSSFITAAVLSSVSGAGKFKDHMEAVQEVMNMRDVPENLQKRVMRYMHYKYSDGKLVDDNKVLNDLPYSLRVEVALLSAGQFLQQVQLLREDPLLLEECSLLLKTSYAAAGELMVKEGFPCEHVYFIASGYVELQRDDLLMTTLGPGKRFNDHAMLPVPKEEDLAADPDLKRKWAPLIRGCFPAVASCRAITNCFFYTLEGTAFVKLLEEFPEAHARLQQIAEQHLHVWTTASARGPASMRRKAFAQGAGAASIAAAVDMASARRRRENVLATKSRRPPPSDADNWDPSVPTPPVRRRARSLAVSSMPVTRKAAGHSSIDGWHYPTPKDGGQLVRDGSPGSSSPQNAHSAEPAPPFPRRGLETIRSLFTTSTNPLGRLSRGSSYMPGAGGSTRPANGGRGHPASRMSMDAGNGHTGPLSPVAARAEDSDAAAAGGAHGTGGSVWRAASDGGAAGVHFEALDVEMAAIREGKREGSSDTQPVLALPHLSSSSMPQWRHPPPQHRPPTVTEGEVAPAPAEAMVPGDDGAPPSPPV